ncbi:hypothetical protein EXE63_23695 [Mycolicibacterium frederiksbergense]|uniref:Uncharacterized protein n=1 Tax=Mycolicibacterium frederiksbergense TaxID=117567 RepID=A0A6H0S7R3_9MYCO|nr:hypothetical protein EXE63_23695 [Mycolicibacterium frederiksbergense]
MWYGSAHNPKTSRVAGPAHRSTRPIGADTRPTKGSYPLGDSSAPAALRYSRRACTGILQFSELLQFSISTPLDDAGLR